MRALHVVALASIAAITGTGWRVADQDALQGTWRVTDARARMSNEPAMNIDGLVDRGTVEFAGNRIIMRQLGNADLAVYEFTLDTLASPRRVRMVDASAPDSGRWTGIYRVSGDTLRLSLPITHSSDRPVPPPSFNAPNTAAYTFTRDRQQSRQAGSFGVVFLDRNANGTRDSGEPGLRKRGRLELRRIAPAHAAPRVPLVRRHAGIQPGVTMYCSIFPSGMTNVETP